MSLSTIYETIQEDLSKVEDSLAGIARIDFPWLSQVLDFSLKAGGKRMRPALVLLSGKLCLYNLKRLLPMAIAVELMHTATLVHDDAIDKSSVRRNRPTVNKLWGEEKAVLLGDYLFARAGEAVTETKTVRVIRLFSQTLAIISGGELNQALNAFNLEQTYEQYLQRIRAKTASLFALSTESGAILSHAPPKVVKAMKEYGDYLGIAFQICDDILDYIGTEEELGKPVASDLMQGTFTLPAMLISQRYPNGNPVKALFNANVSVEERLVLIKQAVDMVQNSDIAERCYKVASDYCAKACDSLKPLPDDANRRYLIELSDYVIKRRK
ncbi:MAG: polyprenyl synthetase family protein [Chloroflexi bacterium]|nr:polyprenyl synthetase family protein [Chloroflexota bacterium]